MGNLNSKESEVTIGEDLENTVSKWVKFLPERAFDSTFYENSHPQLFLQSNQLGHYNIEAVRHWSDLVKQIGIRDYKEVRASYTEQISEEIVALRQATPCGKDLSAEDRRTVEHLVSNELDANKLITTLNREILTARGSGSALSVMSCVMYTIADGLTREYNKNVAMKVRFFLPEVFELESGENGITLIATFSNNVSAIQKAVILKTPGSKTLLGRPDRSSHDLIHEAFVGIAALNRLRPVIPNFVYTYGIFECGEVIPNFENHKKPASWCAHSGAYGANVSYLALEYIPGKTVACEILKGSLLNNAKNVLTLIAQVACALSVAYSAFDFTHYDLHTSNVIVRPSPQNLSTIRYPGVMTGGKDATIQAPFIATLIDYGMSHVKIGERSFGFPDSLYEIGVYRGRGNPAADLFRFCLALLLSVDEKILKLLSTPILGFFSKENFSEVKPMNTEVMSLFFKDLSSFGWALPPFENGTFKFESFLLMLSSIPEIGPLVFASGQKSLLSSETPTNLEEYLIDHKKLNRQVFGNYTRILKDTTTCKQWYHPFPSKKTKESLIKTIKTLDSIVALYAEEGCKHSKAMKAFFNALEPKLQTDYNLSMKTKTLNYAVLYKTALDIIRYLRTTCYTP
jgi:hypothetical protein